MVSTIKSNNYFVFVMLSFLLIFHNSVSYCQYVIWTYKYSSTNIVITIGENYCWPWILTWICLNKSLKLIIMSIWAKFMFQNTKKCLLVLLKLWLLYMDWKLHILFYYVLVWQHNNKSIHKHKLFLVEAEIIHQLKWTDLKNVLSLHQR